MIYPDINFQEWAKKYDLKILRQPCPNCNYEIITDTPFYAKDWIGLEGKSCKSCGYVINSVVARNKDPSWAKGLFE